MPSIESFTEREIEDLVHDFYARIRRDAALGPIFETHVADWDRHEATLVDFWSSVLLRTGRFAGAPMPRHAALPGLSEALFAHWLKLFRQTTDDHPNRALGERAYELAQRVAQSLWHGYQMHQAASRRIPDASHV